MNIIINADDLGCTQEMNDEIFILMDKQNISSATIMANGNFFTDAVNRSKIYPNCSFGCHLNLTEYKPLTNSDILQRHKIVDTNGFTGNLININRHKLIKEALYNELKQQIIKLLDNNVNISHIDSHYHIHTKPELFFIIKKLQKEFNIKKIRISMNYYTNNYSPVFMKKVQKKLWNSALRYYIKTKTTDYFTFVESFYNNLNITNNTTIELMCHPGNILYKEETALLYSNWINKNNLSLISYNDL